MTARRLIILIYVSLVVASLVAARLLPDWDMIDIRPTNEAEIHNMLMMALVLFVVLAAIPFVPGAEIGFGILIVFGGVAAPLVYTAMVGALTLAYVAGRFLPGRWISGFFGKLGMIRAQQLVEDCQTMELPERAEFLAAHVPTRVLPFLLRHRYIALAVLLNLPGNSVLGGGGGLAFAAGASRLFGVPGYILTLLVAVAPVPLAFFLMMPGG